MNYEIGCHIEKKMTGDIESEGYAVLENFILTASCLGDNLQSDLCNKNSLFRKSCCVDTGIECKQRFPLNYRSS